MSKELGPKPNLEHLREQAKDLLTSYRRGETDAIARLREGLPSLKGESPDGSLALHDAQSVIAREYGFPSWPKLIAHVEEVRSKEGITTEIESQFVDACCADDLGRIRRLIELYPGLPRYSPACALVAAELDTVRALHPTEKLPPLGWAPLEYVAYSRIFKAFPDRYEAQLECARDLLDRGADPNTFHLWREDAPETKLSVLFAASGESGHAGIVRLLLERGAETNDGESVYHAAEHDREEILEALLEHGADISKSDPYWGNSPLYFLCGFRETYPTWPTALKGMRWLLEHGADPNVSCQERQETPLHLACRTGHRVELIEMLLDHGADGLRRDRDGNSAYQLAMATGNREAIRLLSERGYEDELKLAHRFLSACSFNDTATIQATVNGHPELTTQLRKEGEALMKLFAELGRTEGLRGLLCAGFPAVGESKTTPLHDACYPGWAESVRVLLDHGAPVDVLDDEHNSPPFGWAIHGSLFQQNPRGNYPEVVRLLLAAGSSADLAREILANQSPPPAVADAIREALP